MDRETEKKIRRIVRGREPRYRRTGECNRCGACCGYEDPPCEHFTAATKTKPAACAIWDDPDRDSMCREWPTSPPIKIATCGFRFVDLVTDKELDLHEVD
jgi:hypothetical protein